MQHFLSIADHSAEELWTFLYRARELKEERQTTGQNVPVLKNKVLGMLFQKPSLRTRVSFEVQEMESAYNGFRAMVMLASA